MLWAASYLCDMLSIERFDGNYGPNVCIQGIPLLYGTEADSLGSL